MRAGGIMNIKKMTNCELIGELLITYLADDGAESDIFNELNTELLRRLEEGQKAIEAMELIAVASEQLTLILALREIQRIVKDYQIQKTEG